MVLKRRCYAHEKGIPKTKAWIAASRYERMQSSDSRNKIKNLNKEVWPVGMQRGTKFRLSTILTVPLQSIRSV